MIPSDIPPLSNFGKQASFSPIIRNFLEIDNLTSDAHFTLQFGSLASDLGQCLIQCLGELHRKLRSPCCLDKVPPLLQILWPPLQVSQHQPSFGYTQNNPASLSPGLIFLQADFQHSLPFSRRQSKPFHFST